MHRETSLLKISANLVLPDGVLAHYSPETMEIRNMLRVAVARMIDQTWIRNNSIVTRKEPTAIGGESIYDKIVELSPKMSPSAHSGRIAEVEYRSWPDTVANVRTARQLDSDAVPGVADFLGNYHLSQLRAFRPSECDRDRGDVPVRTFCFEGDLPDPRTGPSIRRADPNLQHADAQRTEPSRPVARRALEYIETGLSFDRRVRN
jgi:hypothetical protein